MVMWNKQHLCCSAPGLVDSLDASQHKNLQVRVCKMCYPVQEVCLCDAKQVAGVNFCSVVHH